MSAGTPPAPVRSASAIVRPPFVAGTFYPAAADGLLGLVARQLRDAERRFTDPGHATAPAGLLVPHAGLQYSGVVAAAAWRTLVAAAVRPEEPGPPLTVVLLGTNHGAGWLDGIGVWNRGAWSSPLGEVPSTRTWPRRSPISGPPFTIDLEAHLGEHSIEVQLPFLQVVAPTARIVPLAVSAGVGQVAIDAGDRLGRLLASRRAAGDRIVLAISTDMAHYPPAREAALVTSHLQAAILAGDPEVLAADEQGSRTLGLPGLVCGMCGIEPAVVGLAALKAMGTARGTALASATSADAGGPSARTVGYLAVRFD